MQNWNIKILLKTGGLKPYIEMAYEKEFKINLMQQDKGFDNYFVLQNINRCGKILKIGN